MPFTVNRSPPMLSLRLMTTPLNGTEALTGPEAVLMAGSVTSSCDGSLVATVPSTPSVSHAAVQPALVGWSVSLPYGPPESMVWPFCATRARLNHWIWIAVLALLKMTPMLDANTPMAMLNTVAENVTAGP